MGLKKILVHFDENCLRQILAGLNFFWFVFTPCVHLFWFIPKKVILGARTKMEKCIVCSSYLTCGGEAGATFDIKVRVGCSVGLDGTG